MSYLQKNSHATTAKNALTFFAMMCALMLLSATPARAITLAQLQNNIQSVIDGSSSSVSWSVLIENDHGTQTYFSLNADTPRRPASNTKIFTTAAAFGTLGSSHVFQGYQLGSTSSSNPVRAILNNSNNTTADSLYSTVGGGSNVINWCSSIGIDMTGAQMYDGSGLNYSNRFTSRQTLELTKYMRDTYSYNSWANHLTIACVRGTLGSRICGTNTSGNVHGKTGTLTNGQTLSLSGYIDNPNDGERYYFSIYCNGVPSIYQSGTRNRIDTIVSYMGQSSLPNPGAPLGGLVVDNGGTGYSETGSWGTSSGSGYYGTQSRWANAYSGNNTATWTPTISTQGIYDVYVRYVSGSNRSPAASYTVTHLNGSTLLYGTNNNDGIINGINQQSGGGQWEKIGQWEFASGTSGKIVLDSVQSFNGGNSSAVVSSDAVQLVLIQETFPEVIVDNTDAGFTASSNWFPGSYVSGYLGTNYHARPTASTGDAATWKADLPSSGTYEVFVRWTTGGNRATSAPYIVYHTGGSTTVAKNQQSNNGSWQSLGTYSMNSGNSTRVALSCWTGSGDYVIADGVKLVKQ